MRRVLYLGGIFLATGAAIAMAAPAQAAEGTWQEDYVVAGYTQERHVAVVPGDCGHDYDYYCDNGGSYHSSSSTEIIQQNGLFNLGLIDSPINFI
ncbi:hypothetical protein [Actinoplanes sp. CA-252034]|uniref:hypothetical protein n=1 Tax=Actinoplanes sp. CA-252034 TaxID=3239906 RepID=UPI003D97ABC8